jgi:hypothetical protein
MPLWVPGIGTNGLRSMAEDVLYQIGNKMHPSPSKVETGCTCVSTQAQHLGGACRLLSSRYGRSTALDQGCGVLVCFLN